LEANRRAVYGEWDGITALHVSPLP